jgi:hypothetical protein
MEPVEDKRADPAIRNIFLRACDIAEPFISADGSFLTLAHEHRASQALRDAFPDLGADRLFALMVHTRSVRASGRKPVS